MNKIKKLFKESIELKKKLIISNQIGNLSLIAKECVKTIKSNKW